MFSLIFALALTTAQQQDAAATPSPAPVGETARARRARERALAAQKVECREIVPTGSNVPARVCLTGAEWAKARADALDTAQVIRDANRDGFQRR